MSLASIRQKTPASKSPARILGLSARLGFNHAPRLRDLLLRIHGSLPKINLGSRGDAPSEVGASYSTGLEWVPESEGRPSATPSRRLGQAMLVAILIITMAALAIALAVATVSSSEVKMSYSAKQSSQAYFLAEACLENALMRLARTDNSQPPSFTTSQGTCTIKITGSAPYEILAIGQVGDAYRKIQATVSVTNEVLKIEKWEESY